MIQRVKGTQDFCDLSLYNSIIERFKQYANRFLMHEIMTPLLEPFELFHRSLGSHTDVVSKEMFFIQTHDTEKEKICLRPEATASTMRAFIENNIQETPWKVFSHGPMFRYERPQKGRFRQFHQINIEMINTPSVIDDIQIIALLNDYFRHGLNLREYTLHINYLGCRNDRTAYTQRLITFLTDHRAQLCQTCTTRADNNPLRVFDCKQEQCQKLYKKAPILTDNLCDQCTEEWRTLRTTLNLMSISAIQNTHLVRGLDYYNKTVFEFSSSLLGAQNAFCGGGRYDSLGYEISGKNDYPSVGAAIGIERLMLLCEAQNSIEISKKNQFSVIVPMSKDQATLALIIATMLRQQGLSIDIYTTGSSLKSMMRKAHKEGAHYAIIIGEEEQNNNMATIKNMRTSQQEAIRQTEIAAYIQDMH